MKKKFVPFLCIIIFLQILIACEPDDNPEKAPDTPQPAAVERDSMVDISWSPIAGASLYRVYWSENANFTLQTASGSLETSDTQFSHDQLENGTTYFYKITAISSAGESPASPVMPATPNAPPGKPSSITVTSFDSELQVSWNSQPNTLSYELAISTASNMVNPDLYPDSESPFTIQTLTNGQEYFITLTAINDSGNSQPSTPVSAIPSKLYALISGGDHSCAIKQDRSLWCWGRNQYGQTGTGPASEYSVTAPVKVDDLNVNTWETVSAGYESTCGIDTSGQLWCWGDNAFSQLGNTTTTASITPFPVNSDTDWVTVASGGSHHCAIKSDSSLWCWGWNSAGQSGSDGGLDATVPTRVGSAQDQGWIQLSLGSTHSCGLKSDRTLWCWGKASGSPDTTTIAASPELVNNEMDWASLTAGSDHTCAIKDDSSLWCWGYNFYGQVGNSSSGNDSTGNAAFELSPVRVGNNSDWRIVKGTGYNTCALKTDNSLWCWGYNWEGQLGDGTQADKSAPVQIGTRSNWATITHATGYHVCAATRAGDIFCWGTNSYGELGIGGESRPGAQDSWIPVLADNSSNWTRIASGYDHTCASRSDNSIYCWGNNASGQLGEQSDLSKTIPTEVVGIRDWQSVTASNSGNTVCGLKLDGTLWCWGYGSEGQFGNGSSGVDNNSKVPVLVNTDTDWLRVAPGYIHVCAIKTDNTLWCWGSTSDGKLGTGPTVNSNELSPVQVGQESNWASVTTGEQHTCGIKNDRSLWCWGDNSAGQLGNIVDSTLVSINEPARVGNTLDWTSVTLGSAHTCAIKNDSSLWCWGDNFYGQIASDVTDPGQTINVLPGAGWTTITAGYWSTCGIQSDQSLWCWGLNDKGQLGVNHTVRAYTPEQVNPGSSWQTVGIGYQHACGLKTNGSLWCWGSNWYGQLGDGTAWKLTPQLVLFPQ